MDELSYTLLSDGSSDKALQPIIEWVLQENGVTGAIQGEWADLRRLPQPPANLWERIVWAVRLYPCDILFVHRDAEKQPPDCRLGEISDAANRAADEVDLPPYVCVIPVRMHEAWLLVDANAIRRAAGNPSGSMPLNLPSIASIEDLPDPKKILHDLLKQASGLSKRRLRSFHYRECALNIGRFIKDKSILRRLPAFCSFEEDLRQVLHDCPSFF